jgi:hypothetical protein
MMRFRFLVAALALAFLSTIPALADEDPMSVIPEAVPLRDKWEGCAAGKVRGMIQSNLSPETVAERALAACRAEENAVKDLLTRRIGRDEAFTIVELVRNAYRTNLTAIVETIRAR